MILNREGIAVILLALAASLPARERDVSVIVTKSTLADNSIKYDYSVKNGNGFPLVSITVGYDYYTANTELEGDGPLEISSPQGWTGYVISEEESEYYSVRWNANAAQDALAHDETLEGFSVVVGSSVDGFQRGHFDALNGNSMHISELIGQPTDSESSPDGEADGGLPPGQFLVNSTYSLDVVHYRSFVSCESGFKVYWDYTNEPDKYQWLENIVKPTHVYTTCGPKRIRIRVRPYDGCFWEDPWWWDEKERNIEIVGCGAKALPAILNLLLLD